LYANKAYWNERFAVEDDYEWLANFPALQTALEPYLQPPQQEQRILIVGCGNAPFSADLYDAGYTNIVNLDYSATVIDNMKARHGNLRPRMTWICGDMTRLAESFADKPGTVFDIVLDKAAMDALTADEGDVWHPAAQVVARSRSMCQSVAAILAPGGRFLQVSLTQPHFRRPYLLGWHGESETANETTAEDRDPTASAEFGWTLDCQTLHDVGGSGSFGHFLYVMTNARDATTTAVNEPSRNTVAVVEAIPTVQT
jgi:SAM-dependent methyltransferase